MTCDPWSLEKVNRGSGWIESDRKRLTIPQGQFQSTREPYLRL